MRVVRSIGLAGLVLACGSPQPMANLEGFLSLSVANVQRPPGVPVSIGGYAAVGLLKGPDGTTLFNGEIDPVDGRAGPPPTPPIFVVPGGQYQLTVTVLFASDAIEIDQNGNVHRALGPVTATCAATIPVTSPALTAVVVTLVGGQSCSIGASS